jgi:signal peptidase I
VSVRSPRGSASAGGSGQRGDPGAAAKSPGQAPAGSKPKQKSTTNSLLELAAIIAIAVLLALGIQAFLVKPYKIPSGSMEPTLIPGQRVLVNRIGMSINGPHVGEIVVFHPPKEAKEQRCGPTHYEVTPGGAACDQSDSEPANENFIKRVIAGPGDTLSIREGHAYLNGKRESDSYIKACGGVRECNFPTPIKIPPGHWFMMGDNRGESDDSRFWGPVPTGWIIGGAFVTYWPPDRIGII